jgi:uridine kinase
LIRAAGKPGGPVFVGIGGGSASGKSTFAAGLKRALAPLRVQVINQDHFYKRTRLPRYYSRHDRCWHADFNNRRSYRWKQLHDFCRRAKGMDVLVLEGLMALHDPRIRKLMDLMLFVDCPVAERLRRRLDRGVPGWTRRRHRIYWNEVVLPGHIHHVVPTRRHADMIIPNGRGAESRRRRVLAQIRRWIRSRARKVAGSAGRMG